MIDPALAENRSVSLLKLDGGADILALTPERAVGLSLAAADRVDAATLATRIAHAGITLNDPDYLFYLPLAEQDAVRHEPAFAGTRRLTSDDEKAFARFADEAPEDDRDEAFVELDHWLVVGTFVDGRLVAAASMYPWDGTRLADLGTITLPEYRGRGLARATVRAISAQAIAMGYEPQYRRQLDNAPSVALARSAGFVRFGEWQVIVSDAP
ncbi:GNAT family N-acetyltransferase [Lacisediminihabitans sp.]|uniref:GNAT family N-acetyltransferase n=1 Tax=Lacisediminihabitans sp. TaxID=2787631 RepID=UPI00374D90A7